MGIYRYDRKEITPFIYDCFAHCNWKFSEGLAQVVTHVDNEWKSGFIDKTGREVVPCIYTEVYPFKDGLALVQTNKENDYRYGFIDKSGAVVIPCNYVYLGYSSSFDEGLLPARKGLKYEYGFIDNTGRIVIPLKYDDVGRFSEGLAPAKLNGKWGFVDKKGRPLLIRR